MSSVLKTLLFAVAGSAAAVVLGMTVLFFASFGLVKLGEYTSAEKPADAIFVPGARIGGRALLLRLDRAAKLYHEGMAPVILVSGSQGEDEPMTEAAFMAEKLTELGVPEEAIIKEENSFSTEENFRFSLPIMAEKGIVSIIIVTNDYHCYRCGKLAENHGIPYQIEPVPKPKGIYPRGPFRETLAVMWGFFTGEF